MANLDINTFQSSANLSFWFKIQAGDPLNLADIPQIIALRWTYFRDNWNFLVQALLKIAPSTNDPDYFRFVLDQFTTFINQQRFVSADTNPFANNDIYYKFYPIFDNILIENIDLTNEEDVLVASQTAYIKTLSKTDFVKIKNTIKNYRDYLADTVNLGDPDYNRIYDRGNVSSQVDATITDLNLMLTLQKQLDAVNFVLANLFAIDIAVDPFALAKTNANNPNINIGQYNSGFLVKLGFSEDLQGLANRFLNDPNKWIDIAIANGLKEPYIDEIGEQLFLLSNGSGSQINIAMSDADGNPNITKFNINQIVRIQSSTSPFPDQRVITGIKEVPVSGEIVLTLSGSSNLGDYLLSDQASIRIFKPNTVNSSQFVLIPSPTPLPNQRQDEIPWFMTSSASDERKTKIDIAIGDNGALLLTPNGDIALSYGLANGIQAIKLKLLTELGSNRYHPEFGIVNLVGTKLVDPDGLKSLLIKSINTQIQADGRFDRIETFTVELSTTGAVALNIDLSVRLAGSTTVIPISFAIAM